jgi:pimeloyl-ACP methyl ester carboxylesterase
MLRRYLLGRSASDELVRSVACAIAKVSPGVLRHRLRSVLDCDWLSELQSVSVPILYLGGQLDILVVERSAKVIRKARPETEFAVMRAPHLLVQAEPRQVTERAVEFLRKVL